MPVSTSAPEAKLGWLKPADVIVCRTGGIEAEFIRFGAELIDKPNLDNHVVVVDHIDAAGTVWGIEGRPGGVGWVDCAKYFGNGYALTNRRQPKSDEQRAHVTGTMKKLVGTGYDWRAIIEDCGDDLHIPDPWREKWNGLVPGHVVCSSGAIIGYYGSGLLYPTDIDMAHIQPADWTAFILQHSYE
jgi:hypothetical protein